MLLTEILTSAVKWQWVKQTPTEYIATFEIKDYDYRVAFHRDADDPKDEHRDIWHFSFVVGGTNEEDEESGDPALAYTDELTNTGHEFSVFPTVVNIMSSFLQHVNPSRVMFLGSTTDGRSRFYAHLLKFLKPRLAALKYTYADGKPSGEIFGPDAAHTHHSFELTRIK